MIASLVDERRRGLPAVRDVAASSSTRPRARAIVDLMNQYEAETSILKRWRSVFTPAAAAVWTDGVETFFDNNAGEEPEPPAVWATVALDDLVQLVEQTMGSPRRMTYRGTLYAKICYPAAGAGSLDDGTKVLVQIGDVVRETMASKQFDEGVGEDGVITKDATIRGVGEDGRWWILAVVIPYEYTLITS